MTFSALFGMRIEATPMPTRPARLRNVAYSIDPSDLRSKGRGEQHIRFVPEAGVGQCQIEHRGHYLFGLALQPIKILRDIYSVRSGPCISLKDRRLGEAVIQKPPRGETT